MELSSLKEKSERALQAMEDQANKFDTPGTAVILYSPKTSGEDLYSFTRIVGSISKIKEDRSGYNLFALAYSKIAESIETGEASGGDLGRPLIEGEFGYRGSVVYKGSEGFVISSFSGSTEDVDCAVAKAGLESFLTEK